MCFRWLWYVLEGYGVTLGFFGWLLCGCGVFLHVYRVFKCLLDGSRVLYMALGWLWGGLDPYEVAPGCYRLP